MDFAKQNPKNIGMPSRQISPQSFDEILSDLGDDPAIPDPHGIRKTPSSKPPSPTPHSQSNKNANLAFLKGMDLSLQTQKLGGPLLICACLLGVCGGLYLVYESFISHTQLIAQSSQKEISALQKEWSLLREELQQEQDSLYEAFDILEVSVHSVKENRLISKPPVKPKVLLHEGELSRWRYLGNSQKGATHQAIFHTGKQSEMFDKGSFVLGEWRLSQIEKEAAILTHSHGRTLVLKPSKSE